MWFRDMHMSLEMNSLSINNLLPLKSPQPKEPGTQTNSHFWNFWILTYYGRAILVFYAENKHKTVQGKDQSTKVWLSNYLNNLTFFGNLNAHAADSPCLVYRKRWTLRKQHPLLMHLCKSNRRRITAVLVNRHGGRGVTFAAPMLS